MKELISVAEDAEVCFGGLDPGSPRRLSRIMEAGRQFDEEIREVIEQGRHAFVLPRDDTLEWIGPPRPKHSNHLDIKYPHICFKCKRKLKFIELYGINREYSEAFNMPLYKRLKKLWKSEFVKFYCCTCFTMEKGIISP